MSGESCGSDLDQAREHLRQAARTFGERLVGSDTAHHLRQAARHALQAGISAIDRAEERSPRPGEPAKPGTDAGPGPSSCCGNPGPSAPCP